MEYFDRFAWAVPWAFHDALNLCRFERGDTLYDTAEAYGPDWSLARELIRASIQVRSPEQQQGSPDLAGHSVFRANWKSEVRIDVFSKLNGVRADVVSTQGRLYTALWRGDLTVLDLAGPEPSPPTGRKSVHKALPDAKAAIRQRWRGTSVFVIAHDVVSSASQDKVATVAGRLRAHLVEGPVLLSPAEAGIQDPGGVAPTVYVAAFPVRGLTEVELVDVIMSALYQPDPTAKNPKFRLSAHGAVF